MGAATRGVFFFARDHEARTHHAVVHAAAFADADAAQHRAFDAPFVVWKFEIGLRRPRAIVGAETKIFGWMIRSDDLAGVHLPLRIPQRFEFAECVHELFTEHLRHKPAA